jgi:hypothetical protein
MHYAGQEVPTGFGPTFPPTISPVPSNFRLTLDDIKKAGSFRFPVHACGYNWLDSNAKSAQRLKKKIEDVIKKYAEAKDPDGKPAFECKHVIVVTHSMGGLVGRMAAKLLKYEGNEDKILGVIHGEMPALGAPVLYRRMACGTESAWSFGDMAFSQMAGSTAPDTTPVLAYSPGAMQLAPTPDYPGSWLFAELIKNGRTQPLLSLPANKDPYGEIFLAKGKWYCPAVEEFLDPANQHKLKKNGPWGEFSRTVREARLFHKGAVAEFEKQDEKEHFLGRYYHPNTYAHYGADPEKATFPAIRWRGEVTRIQKSGPNPEFFQTAPLDASNGEEKRWVDLGVPDEVIRRQLEMCAAPDLQGSNVVTPNAKQEFKCLMSHKHGHMAHHIATPVLGNGHHMHRPGQRLQEAQRLQLQCQPGAQRFHLHPVVRAFP